MDGQFSLSTMSDNETIQWECKYDELYEYNDDQSMNDWMTRLAFIPTYP